MLWSVPVRAALPAPMNDLSAEARTSRTAQRSRARGIARGYLSLSRPLSQGDANALRWCRGKPCQRAGTLVPRVWRIGGPMKSPRIWLSTSLVCLSLVSAPLLLRADSGPDHQAVSRPLLLGTSGGNIYDRSTAWCCSGTLGALVRGNADGKSYI